MKIEDYLRRESMKGEQEINWSELIKRYMLMKKS